VASPKPEGPFSNCKRNVSLPPSLDAVTDPLMKAFMKYIVDRQARLSYYALVAIVTLRFTFAWQRSGPIVRSRRDRPPMLPYTLSPRPFSLDHVNIERFPPPVLPARPLSLARLQSIS